MIVALAISGLRWYSFEMRIFVGKDLKKMILAWLATYLCWILWHLLPYGKPSIKVKDLLTVTVI